VKGINQIPKIIIYWILILWVTLTCAIRYVHTFYKFDKSMLLQIIIALALILLLCIDLYIMIDSYKDFLFYLVLNLILWYTALLCFAMAFYIFIDMNFDLTINSFTLAIAGSIFLEIWAISSYIIIKHFEILLCTNGVLIILAYIIFLYTRWRHNK